MNDSESWTGRQHALLSELELRNLRSFRDASLDLNSLTVFVGVNGSGKTTIIDSLRMLKAAGSGSFDEAISNLGGVYSLYRKDAYEPISISARIDGLLTNEEALAYSFDLEAANAAWAITSETLQIGNEEPGPVQMIRRQGRFGPKGPPGGFGFSFHGQHPLSEGAPASEVGIQKAIEFFSGMEFYSGLPTGMGSPVRGPQRFDPVQGPGQDGSTLVSHLFSLRENEPGYYEMVEDSLRAMYPSFDGLGFVPVGGGLLAMNWKDKRFSQPIFQSDLSAGTLRFLWILAILTRPNKPSIIVIDEVEDSFHPSLIHLLAELLREAATFGQVIVTTHSDRLVGSLNPEEVVVLNTEEEDGETIPIRKSSSELADWLEEYSLDRLWRMGVLGSRT